MVRSQGLSRNVLSVSGLLTKFPLRSITCSEAPVVIVPIDVGRLPTNMKPPFSTPRAVVRPIGVLVKKVVALPGVVPAGTDGVTMPLGVNLMIVVPVPCILEELLKFDTNISPGATVPPAGNPFGTTATPEGFKSPFAG